MPSRDSAIATENAIRPDSCRRQNVGTVRDISLFGIFVLARGSADRTTPREFGSGSTNPRIR